MVNPAYVRGRSFELERVHFHRASGAYLAIRSPASRGPWDVLALYSHRVVLEQCKRVTELHAALTFERERRYLATFSVPPGVETFLVVRGDRGLTRLFPIHRHGKPAIDAPPLDHPASSDSAVLAQ